MPLICATKLYTEEGNLRKERPVFSHLEEIRRRQRAKLGECDVIPREEPMETW